MQLIIESPHVAVDNKLQKLIMDRFGFIGKIYDRIVKCQVLLKKEPDNRENFFSIEAILILPGCSLFARDKAETFEMALHKVIDDITRQLRRYKDKREEIW